MPNRVPTVSHLLQRQQCAPAALSSAFWLPTNKSNESIFSSFLYKFARGADRRELTDGQTDAHPKPRLSLKSSANSEAYTKSFLGTQPRRTHVPPAPPTASLDISPKGSSHTATLAPAPPHEAAQPQPRSTSHARLPGRQDTASGRFAGTRHSLLLEGRSCGMAAKEGQHVLFCIPNRTNCILLGSATILLQEGDLGLGYWVRVVGAGFFGGGGQLLQHGWRWGGPPIGATRGGLPRQARVMDRQTDGRTDGWTRRADVSNAP
jgi:hypothetical protein